MKRKNAEKSRIKQNNSREGVSLEHQIRVMMNNKEKLSGDVKLIYTERKDGTLPAYNIRTDRFEVALDGMDKIQKSYQARREEKVKMEVIKDDQNRGPIETQGTGN